MSKGNSSLEAIQDMRDAIVEQAITLARQIKEMKIIVGAAASEDKSFDHYIAFADKSDKIAENILKLDRKLDPNYKEGDEELTGKSKGPLESRFGGNK